MRTREPAGSCSTHQASTHDLLDKPSWQPGRLEAVLLRRTSMIHHRDRHQQTEGQASKRSYTSQRPPGAHAAAAPVAGCGASEGRAEAAYVTAGCTDPSLSAALHSQDNPFPQQARITQQVSPSEHPQQCKKPSSAHQAAPAALSPVAMLVFVPARRHHSQGAAQKQASILHSLEEPPLARSGSSDYEGGSQLHDVKWVPGAMAAEQHSRLVASVSAIKVPPKSTRTSAAAVQGLLQVDISLSNLHPLQNPALRAMLIHAVPHPVACLAFW